MDKISDQDLKLEQVPPNDDFKLAAQFAHSVDYLDTFEETAKVAKSTRDKILTDATSELALSELRISLFFYFRSIRHTGADPDFKLINNHLDLIRSRISN